MSHLSQEDLEWIDCYDIGDTVLFLSNYNNCDTLVVCNKYIENSSNPFFIHFFDNYMGDKYEATAQYSFHVKKKKDSIYGHLRMTKLAENDSIEWYPLLGDRLSNKWPFVTDFSKGKRTYLGSNPIPVTDLMINGRMIKNCLSMDSCNSHLIQGTKIESKTIESFIISRDSGLIQYKLHDGEEFIRIFE